jgi:hypothetical protein
MKCRKRSFAVVILLFAVLLSFSIETLNARDADLASRTFAAAQTVKQQCINTCRVSGSLPGLHPIHMYWVRTRMMTDRFGRSWGLSGHCAAVVNRSLLTHSVISPPSIDALQKVHSP